jgi:hypothetical protein
LEKGINMSQTYASNDFNDIMESLVLFMRNQSEFKDMNFDGSAIRELLRVLAFNSQQQAFQNNFLYNELQFDSAQLRPNVTSLASRLGYVPSSKTAAKMKVNITVTPGDPTGNPNSLSLNKDVQFYATKDTQTFILSPDGDYTANYVSGTYIFNNVNLLQGIWTINAFMVQNQLGDDNFVVPNYDIDINTLAVGVRNFETSGTLEIFNQFKTAHDLSPESKLFYIRENRDGLYEFKFGDNKFSRRLNYGNIVNIKYLVTKGILGNNLSKIAPASSIGGYYDIKVDYIDNFSYGGADQEDIESIRTLAPISFASSGNAVTPGDYVGLTKKLFPEAADSICWGGEHNNPPKYGYVFVSVIPKNSETLSNSQKTDLQNILKQYNVGSISPIVVDPIYTYINVDSKVKYKPSSLNLTTAALTNKIIDYAHIFSKQKMEKFSGAIDTSIFSEYINNIDPAIKGNYTLISYEKRFTPLMNVLSSYVLDFGHILKKGTIKAIGFRIPDINSTGCTYSIVDADGILSIIKTLDVDGTVTKLIDNCGIVDYANGLVRIDNFKPSALVGSHITVVASSDYSDDQSLIGVQNSILKINNVNVTLLSVDK